MAEWNGNKTWENGMEQWNSGITAEIGGFFTWKSSEDDEFRGLQENECFSFEMSTKKTHNFFNFRFFRSQQGLTQCLL